MTKRTKWAGIICAAGCAAALAGCGGKNEAGLDPRTPVTVTIWHYYNGAQKLAFDAMIDEFNQTVGQEKGIVVEEHNKGDVTQLEESVMSSINGEAGSEKLPDVLASYADTAYTIDRMGLALDLDQYLTEEEQGEYVDSYIEEGRIGENGELKIFPVVKSTEVLMINKTAWDAFAADTGASLEALATYEGVAETAESFYRWTDGRTPDIPEDGKAFYGRDAFANLMIIGSRQLGYEIFQVDKGEVTLNVDEEAMRRIWDTYYVPYINGYFGAYGRFRSDDVKVGKIVALTGSTSSASYFPSEVTEEEDAVPIEVEVLPAPVFEGGEKYAVQQGAGMMVLRSEEKREYASVLFLKWLTERERNLTFSAMSGYLPVREDANDYRLLEERVKEEGLSIPDTVMRTMKVSFDVESGYTLYTNKAFKGGNDARRILEENLPEKAEEDREAVLAAIAGGASRREAVAVYDTDENFEEWLHLFKQELKAAVGQ